MVRGLWIFYIFISFSYGAKKSGVEQEKLYLATERPVVTYMNPKYMSFVNMTTTRYGRLNPLYYVNIHMTTLYTFDNNVTATFWFYEYYSSHYRPTFLELSYKWCNLIYKDPFFGPAMRKNLPKTCPHKPDTYHLYNMTVYMGAMPNLSFSKGRIYCNVTTNRDTIASGHIDMELKRRRTPQHTSSLQ